MSKKQQHNTIYFLTTLSVYLGLVLVGSSPHVISRAKTAKNSQTQRFEITTKTNSVLSKLKYKTNFENAEILPFAVTNGIKRAEFGRISKPAIEQFANLYAQIASENNQVFVVSNFPRASI